jgi:hypothetical protein
MAKKPIRIKPQNEGSLRRVTGTPKGKNIPEKTLQKEKRSPDPAMRRKATFAENARHWNR